MASQYHFLSEYAISSGPQAVWTSLVDVEGWTSWWSWLKRLDVVREPSAADGLGAIYRNTIKAPTGYGFVYDTEIVKVDPGRRIDVISSGGIVGRGRFLLEARDGGGTNLGFAWLVETPARWMNLLAPIARPAFTWNHDKLMSDFGTGLAGVTGGSLSFMRNSTRKPGSEGFWVMPEELAIPL